MKSAKKKWTLKIYREFKLQLKKKFKAALRADSQQQYLQGTGDFLQ